MYTALLNSRSKVYHVLANFLCYSRCVQVHHSTYRLVIFIILFAIIGFLTWTVVQPIANLLFASLVFSIIVWPLYKKFAQKTGNRRRLSSFLTVSTSMVMIVIPAILFVQILVLQVLSMVGAARTQYVIDSVPQLVGRANDLLSYLPDNAGVSLSSDQIISLVTQNIQPIGDWIVNSLLVVSNFSVGFVINVTFLFLLVFFILPNLPEIKNVLISLSPLSAKATQQYLLRSYAMLMDVLRGVLLVALAQGLLAGIFLAIVGVPAWAFWTFVMMVLSAIPMLGVGFVMIPIGIMLILSGNVIAGVATLAWMILVVGTIDNYLRSILVSKQANVHPAVMMLAVLGGLKAFGVMGILYGPLIIVMFLTTLAVYKQEYFAESVAHDVPQRHAESSSEEK